MREALRRDDALGQRVGRARAITEFEALTIEQRARDRAERALIELARAARDHADALDRQRATARVIRQQPFDARAERRQRAGEHAGIGAPEQLVQREQRGELLAGQPQPG